MAGTLDPNAVPGTSFLVDCFKDRKKVKHATVFFLSHYHADHYGGLNEKWAAGPIYCSPATAKLVVEFLEVDPKYVHELEFNRTYSIEDVKVTLMDANHCPGAAMLLFAVPLPEGVVHHLHTGDCRFTPRMLEHPSLQGKHIDNLFLDTTYANTKYVFPAQGDTVEFIARTIAHEFEENKGRTLVLVATYSIGKEKILLRTHELTGCKIEVTERKYRMLRHCNLGVELDDIFTTEHLASSIRIVGWHELGQMAQGGWTFLPDYPRLHDMLDHYAPRFDKIMAFYPTGWTYTIAQAVKKRAQTATAENAGGDGTFKMDEDEDVEASEDAPASNLLAPAGNVDDARTADHPSSVETNHLSARPAIMHASETKNKVTVYTVPYSEHSNFNELRAFVGGICPTNVIPTVVGGGRNVKPGTRLRKITSLFQDLVDRTKAAASFVAMMQGRRLTRRSSRRSSGPIATHACDNDHDVAQKQSKAIGQELLMPVKNDSLESSPVSCPHCSRAVPVESINEHLDTCLNSRQQRGSPAATRVAASGGNTGRTKREDKEVDDVVEIVDEEQDDLSADPDPDDKSEASDIQVERSETIKLASDALKAVQKAPRSDKAQQVLDMLGGAIDDEQAALLLRQCKDNVSKAVNHFFDHGPVVPPQTRRASTATLSRQSTIKVNTSRMDAADRTHKSPQGKTKRSASKQSSLTSYFLQPQSKKGGKAASRTGGSSLGIGNPGHQAEKPRPPVASQPLTASPEPRGIATPPASERVKLATTTASSATDKALAGSDPPYRIIADLLEQLVQTSSRLKIVALLAETYAKIYTMTKEATGQPDAEALLATVYLTTNHLAPSYKGVELGIGERLVAGVVAEASGRKAERMREDYKETGDLGDVAARALKSQRALFKPKPLTIKGVFKALHSIAGSKGKGSQAAKRAIVHKLIIACDGPEARFIVRTLIANLRTGAVGLTIHTAIGHAMVDVLQLDMSKDEAAQRIKDVYAQHPNWDSIIPALVAGGFEQLDRDCGPCVGVPVTAMLGKITRSLDDVMKQYAGKDYQAEFKYDGCRAQVHVKCEDGQDPTCYMFSRHLEDMSTRYPDGIAAVLEAARDTSGDLRFKSCVLDAEIVAVDNDGVILPFQTLMNRARKDVDEADVSISVKVYLFDMMMLNDHSLIKLPLRHRCQLMQLCFKPIVNRLDFVQSFRFSPDGNGSHSEDDLRTALVEAIDARCEGLMVKALGPDLKPDAEAQPHAIAIQQLTRELVEKATGIDKAYRGRVRDVERAASQKKKALKKSIKAAVAEVVDPLALSTYQPSKRCENWLKVKKDYIEGMGDSLDLVVIGAWWGNGRKATWFSPFLLACYNPDTEQLESVCKVMSGFTDEFYKTITAQFKQPDQQSAGKKAYYNVAEAMTPSIWLEPLEVWEIRGADFTVSPVHRAATGCVAERPGSGISMRFPRFIRRRPDKTFEEATTSRQIAEMYHKQFANGSSNPAEEVTAMDEEDDDII
eukprot:TRINITY_DN12092_c0_g1_i2.p1 TRINITY_DN12092_c0_g1~~TRINITY_DN12092_c0_g1_i2.p1  ORF type:complete len:1489 (+),score=272.53 TRINITY_DN12092_c0_g1_i2:30-4496(+)